MLMTVLPKVLLPSRMAFEVQSFLPQWAICSWLEKEEREKSEASDLEGVSQSVIGVGVLLLRGPLSSPSANP